jgi:SAM-dependent methyltransferase
MEHLETNRFEDFFEEVKYRTLKNSLYNYLLRKMAIEKIFKNQKPERVLEVGSGISPVMTRTSRMIYSDLSYTAIKILKQSLHGGGYVVADGAHLPFKSGSFSHTISSEVLEHLEDDQSALNEMARVMRPQGHLILTFPHCKFYFSNDDRFVEHYRRYDLADMTERLKLAGLKPLDIQKVLGPLEKVTMMVVVYCYERLQKFIEKKSEKGIGHKPLPFASGRAFLFKWANRIFMIFAWLDARMWPRRLSTVILINSIKSGKTVVCQPDSEEWISLQHPENQLKSETQSGSDGEYPKK